MSDPEIPQATVQGARLLLRIEVVEIQGVVHVGMIFGGETKLVERVGSVLFVTKAIEAKIDGLLGERKPAMDDLGGV
jgi:hypothetical protein